MSSVPSSALAAGRDVTFLTDDRVHLRGTFWDAAEEPAITLLLIHDFGETRAQWAPYVPAFRSRGWNVLTFDLRGHGESVRQDMRPDLLAPDPGHQSSPDGFAHDLRAALAFAARQPKADASRIAACGVGVGSDLAYAASGRGWGTATSVLFGLDDARARSLAGHGTFAPRSIYLMYGTDDPVSSAAIPAFAQTAGYPSESFAYPGTPASGMALLTARQPETLARTIAWIEKTL